MSDSDGDNQNQLTFADQRTRSAGEGEHTEAFEINPQDSYISVNNVRMFSLTELPLDQFENCTVLEVRKNLIHDLIPLPDKLRNQLEEVDLFDNKIKHIAPYFSAAGHPLFSDPRWVAHYPNAKDCSYPRLKKLDLSYNQIKVINGLDSLAGTLEELYLVENRIKVIENLGQLRHLKLLELGGNQIRAVGAKSLEGLSSLEQLWLGKNKISSLDPQCFNHCPGLKRLSLQANRLTEVPKRLFTAGHLPNLSELFLSENGLSRIENIESLRGLTLLDYSFNPIASLALQPEVVDGSEGEKGETGACEPSNTNEPSSSDGQQANDGGAGGGGSGGDANSSNRSSGDSVAGVVKKNQLQQQEEGPEGGEGTTKSEKTQQGAAAAASSSAPSPATGAGTDGAASTPLNKTILTVQNFPNLEEFWMTDGKLEDWREVAIFSQFERTLRTVYFERNPLERDRRYRDKIYQQLPFVTQIDSWPVVNKGNLEADRAIHRR